MRNFPCGGSVNLGKVRHRITYFGKLYALSAVRLERKLAGHRELHLQPPLYTTEYEGHFTDSVCLALKYVEEEVLDAQEKN
jgi:hypothetical protein